MRSNLPIVAVILALCLAASMSLGAEPAMSPAIPPDITVAADGSGAFKSIHQAVQSIPKDNRQRTVILIKNGVYREKVRIDAACITLRGQSRDQTRIEFSQLNDDFTKDPDTVGRAVVNINGDDTVLENLTIANTAGVVGPHAFAIYGKADRTVILDCDVLSDGADTVSLWRGDTGRYYHARCKFRGAVDFVCPRGWCFIRDSSFYETKATAALWHDGSKNKDQKFVLRNCTFDGVEGWTLARHHHDAALYMLDCTFSKTMRDCAPFRVIYPLDPTSQPTEADTKRNEELKKTNQWGERIFFHNCHRAGADDFSWHADNLAIAPGALKPADITPAWTFGGAWDPERAAGPRVTKVTIGEDAVTVTFSEPVTVKGQPRLRLEKTTAAYERGSGTDTLSFGMNFHAGDPGKVSEINPDGGAILASQAAATLRSAELALP